MGPPRERAFVPAFLSGGLAGIFEISICYPVEFWKVNTMLGIPGQPPTSAGAARGIYNKCLTQGYFRTLYTGSPAFFLFAFPRSAIRFSAFETTKKALPKRLAGDETLKDLICGGFAGLIESVLCLTPQNNMSVKLTKQGIDSEGPRKGFFAGVKESYGKVGFRGFILPGLNLTAVKNTTNYAIRFTVFNMIKRRFESALPPGENLETYKIALSGMVAGGLSALVTQPVDTIRTYQMAVWTPKDRPNMLRAARALIANGGGSLFSLYRGMLPRFVRVSMEISLLFTFYEKIFGFVDEMVGVGERRSEGSE